MLGCVVGDVFDYLWGWCLYWFVGGWCVDVLFWFGIVLYVGVWLCGVVGVLGVV